MADQPACSVCEDSGFHMIREPGDGKLIVLGDCPHCMEKPQRITPGAPVDASGVFYFGTNTVSGPK